MGMSCPNWQWHRTGSSWSPVRTLPVAPLWCDLGFVPNSRGNKAAANLRPKQRRPPSGERKSKGIPQSVHPGPLPRPAVWLNILVRQVEAEAAIEERRAHRRAAKKQARSENDMPASNFDPNFASVLSPACVPPQSWSWLLDASELGPCAASHSLFACAFLGVFSGVLVQLRFDDVWVFSPGQSAVRNYGL